MSSQIFLVVMRFGTTALVVAGLASSLSGVASAQDETSQCSEEIFNVSQEMQQQYGVNVSPPTAVIIDDPVNPFPGSHLRYFTMVTNYSDENPYVKKATFNAANFMNSTGIQLRLAKRVMMSCPSTSKVSFGFARSSYLIEYFRMPSGQVREGIAIDCGRDNGDDALQWGYFYSC